MPAPAPIKCPAQDCATQYQTPDNLPTYELVTTHLQMHIATNHAPAAVAQGVHLPVPRLEKLPRPSFSPEMSQSVVSEAMKVQQLQARCDQDLLRFRWQYGAAPGPGEKARSEGCPQDPPHAEPLVHDPVPGGARQSLLQQVRGDRGALRLHP